MSVLWELRASCFSHGFMYTYMYVHIFSCLILGVRSAMKNLFYIGREEFGLSNRTSFFIRFSNFKNQHLLYSLFFSLFFSEVRQACNAIFWPGHDERTFREKFGFSAEAILISASAVLLPRDLFKPTDTEKYYSTDVCGQAQASNARPVVFVWYCPCNADKSWVMDLKHQTLNSSHQTMLSWPEVPGLAVISVSVAVNGNLSWTTVGWSSGSIQTTP